jgi:hypothetical protein
LNQSVWKTAGKAAKGLGVKPDPQYDITLFIIGAPNNAAMAIEPGQGLTIAAGQGDIGLIARIDMIGDNLFEPL